MYPNEKDMRKLLSWLMEKLPKLEKSDEGEGGLLGTLAVPGFFWMPSRLPMCAL